MENKKSSTVFSLISFLFIFANMEEKEKQIERAESRLVVLRGKQVIIDRDVAELYGVETKRVNEALRNNPDKFPEGYVITLEKSEKDELVEKFRPVQ